MISTSMARLSPTETTASLVLFATGQASATRVAQRTAEPARTRTTLPANAGPYPRRPARAPPRRGPKIDPNPWTALKAPRERARPPSGARRETNVELATLITAQQAPTPAWRATTSARRGMVASPERPSKKKDPKSKDRPTVPYSCIGRLPREETQSATRGYTAANARIAPIKKRARIELKPPPTRAGPAANHTTPRARPMTQPVAVIRLMAANRAGHSLRSEPSIRRTVPAGPLAAPRSPASKFER